MPVLVPCTACRPRGPLVSTDCNRQCCRDQDGKTTVSIRMDETQRGEIDADSFGIVIRKISLMPLSQALAARWRARPGNAASLGSVLLTAVWLAAWPHVALSQDLTGKPVVLDGNTIEIAGQPIRLFGIQAPGRAETCGSGNRKWPCGENAGFALSRLIGTHWVTCRERTRSPTGVIAICHAAGPQGPDLNAQMLANGWARASASAPPAYRDHERRARRAGKGIWGDRARSSRP